MKALILTFLALILVSCSNEVYTTENKNISRPTIPIQNIEVQIGTQVWMTKNLNVSRYRNGDPIPQVTDPTQWGNLTTGAWCYYNNDPVNGRLYGKLYNGYALSDTRGLAPQGFHVPSEAELTTLITFLGGDLVAGGKMKAISGWISPNTAATNSSGFTCLPGGWRNYSEPGGYIFENIGTLGYVASTTEVNAFARYLVLPHYTGSVYKSSDGKTNGYSVRCLRD